MKRKNNEGITLVALVITIILMLILAGVVVNLTLGQDGIIAKTKEAKKKQILAEAKEKIGVELLTAQAEAIEKDKTLEQEQIENVISKYGQLQEDGDTIILNNNGYEISLLEIYKGTTITGESNAEYEAKIAALEQQIEKLKEQLNSAPSNEVLYSYCTSIHTRNVSIVETDVTRNTGRGSNDVVWGICTFKSEKLNSNGALSLPAGRYTFSSIVPTRIPTYGVGYKVFSENGDIIVDHTSAALENTYASTDFELSEQTNITVKWYRTNSNWTDLACYTINAN